MQKNIKEKKCEHCNNCRYVGDDDFLCFVAEYEYAEVLSKSGPTDNYLICNGEHFTPRVQKKRKGESIVTACMERCYICGSPYVEVHHCIGGTGRRALADEYGLVVPLCQKHHTGGPESAHRDPYLNRRFKELAQEAFEREVGTREEFIKIFDKSYL